MPNSKLFTIFLILNLLVLNFAFVYLYFNKSTPLPVSTETVDKSENLQQKIDQLKADLLVLQQQSSSSSSPTTTVPTVVSLVSSPQTSYIPVPGSGSLLVYQWTKIPNTEFYFNPSDFPSMTIAYFEANMKLLNGNGLAYLRLFDLTAGIELWGSEVQTDSQTNTVIVSSPLTFRSGNHLICVQAKSLTADTTVFNSGRLKIITN